MRKYQKYKMETLKESPEQLLQRLQIRLKELFTVREKHREEQSRTYYEELSQGRNYQRKACPPGLAAEIKHIQMKIVYQKKKIDGSAKKHYLEHRDDILAEKRKTRAKTNLEKADGIGNKS